MSPRQTLAPDAATFERLAEAAVAALPGQVREHLDGIAIRIEEFADAEMLASVDLDDPWELTGLYTGRPLTEDSSPVSGELMPIIHLFRRPLLDEWADTGVSLEALVTHVVVHEIGHHFGLSDADMHALEAAAG